MSKKWRKAAQIQASEPTHLRLCASESIEIVAADPTDKKKLPSFTMTAYTGVPMRLEGFYHPVVIDLASASAPNQSVPVPIGHDTERLAGHTTKIEIAAKSIRASGVLSAENEHSANVVKTAGNGFPWQASIGGSPAPGTKKPYTFVPEGESVVVNARSWDGPIYVAKNVIIREISLVPMGSDGNTAASIAAQHGGETAMEFTQWLQAKGYDQAKLTAQETAFLQAAFDAEKKFPAPHNPRKIEATAPAIQAGQAIDIKAEAAAGTKAVRDAMTAETVRANAIRRICASEPNLETEVEIDGQKQKVNVQEHALAAGWTAQETELVVLRANRAKPVGGIAYSTSAPDVNEAVLEAAVLQAGRCRLFDDDFYAATPERDAIPALKAKTQRELKARYTDQVQQTAHTMFRGGITLQKLLSICARQGGYRGSDSIDDSNLEHVLRAAFRPEIRAEGFSTASIANVLANVQNKKLLEGYVFTEQSWRSICAIRSVKDFKPTKGVRLLSDTTFMPLGPGGELKHATLSDQAFANQAATKGIMLTITRELIINDDLSALTTIPMMIGRGAGLAINDLVWTKFMNPGFDEGGSTNFFAATHTLAAGQFGNANYSSGGTTALSSAALTAAVLLFDNQVDPKNKPLGVDPSILLFPSDLASTALELLTAQLIVYGGTTKTPNTNIWKDRFTPVKSRYLNKSAFTGYSTTAWYLLMDPSIVPVIELVFVNGQTEPIVQTAQADFSNLGISMRGYFDPGVAMQDFRGGLKMAGA